MSCLGGDNQSELQYLMWELKASLSLSLLFLSIRTPMTSGNMLALNSRKAGVRSTWWGLQKSGQSPNVWKQYFLYLFAAICPQKLFWSQLFPMANILKLSFLFQPSCNQTEVDLLEYSFIFGLNQITFLFYAHQYKILRKLYSIVPNFKSAISYHL